MPAIAASTTARSARAAAIVPRSPSAAASIMKRPRASDTMQQLVEIEHAGGVERDELAVAVAGHHVRLDPERAQHVEEPGFDRAERGLRDVGARQRSAARPAGRLVVEAGREDDAAERAALDALLPHLSASTRSAALEDVARISGKATAMSRSMSGTGCPGRGRSSRACRRRASSGRSLNAAPGGSGSPAVSSDSATAGEPLAERLVAAHDQRRRQPGAAAPASSQRHGEVAQFGLRRRRERARPSCRTAAATLGARRRRARRAAPSASAAAAPRAGRSRRRVLLEHDVEIGAAEAEGADAGAARVRRRRRSTGRASLTR